MKEWDRGRLFFVRGQGEVKVSAREACVVLGRLNSTSEVCVHQYRGWSMKSAASQIYYYLLSAQAVKWRNHAATALGAIVKSCGVKWCSGKERCVGAARQEERGEEPAQGDHDQCVVSSSQRIPLHRSRRNPLGSTGAVINRPRCARTKCGTRQCRGTRQVWHV